MKLKLILYSLLAVWVLCPMLVMAQDSSKNPLKIEGTTRSGFVNSENQANTKELNDNYQASIKAFKAAHTTWNLVGVTVEKSSLIANASNFQQLNDEAKESLGKDMFYVEGNGNAILANESKSITPLFFGSFTENNNELTLFHKVEGCENCSKTLKFTRIQEGNKLVLKLNAEDESLSDVYYLLTFTK